MPHRQTSPDQHALPWCSLQYGLWLLLMLGSADHVSADWSSPPSGLFLPYGLTVGYLSSETHAGTERSGKLGGELSLAAAHDRVWYGGYTDATYDITGQRAWLSLGPELGTALLGMDAGAVLVAGVGGTRAGYRLRAVLNFPIANSYSPLQFFVGGGALESGTREPFFETGFLLKLENKLHN